jgi:hypothetical protein
MSKENFTLAMPVSEKLLLTSNPSVMSIAERQTEEVGTDRAPALIPQVEIGALSEKVLPQTPKLRK